MALKMTCVLCLLVFQVASAARFSTSGRQKAASTQGSNATSSKGVATDPEWCWSSVTPGACKGIQKIQCPDACAGKTKPGEDDDSEGAQDAKLEHLTITDISSDTSPLQKLKIMKSEAFQEMWPGTCDGMSLAGRQLNVNTDGFRCEHDTGKIAQIVSPAWKSERSDVCCNNKCADRSDLANFAKSCNTLSLKDSSRAVALSVTELTTASGKEVEVHAHMRTEEEIHETGVIAHVEVRMMGGTLQFEPNKAILNKEGKKFLSELGKPLSALISLQVSAAKKENEVLNLHFCAHASTSCTENDIKKWPSLEKLPVDRAHVVADALQAAVPAGEASVGQPIGHWKHENGSRFQGAIAGFMLYKIYDSSFSYKHPNGSPECHQEDLYEFTADLPEQPACGSR